MAIEDHRHIVKRMAWDSEAQTQAFAEALAGKLRAGATGADALIELHGDLGAGKTTLARHLLKALGVTGRVKSPTYAVVEPYSVADPAAAGGVLSIWHFDFFRFNDPDEWEEAGFRDIFASPGGDGPSGAPQVREARLMARQCGRRFDSREELHPFGWDDLCA